MESHRPPAPPHHRQHHHQPPQGMMVHHHHNHHNHHNPSNNYYQTTQNIQNNSSSNPQMITTHNSSSSSPSILQSNRFPPFSSPQAVTPLKTVQSSSLEPLNFDGSSQSGFGSDPNSSSKKKRGRPRKYSPDNGGNNIALGLTPTPLSPSFGGGSGGGGGGGGADSGGTALSSENPSKRHRGRPPSLSKRQLDALGNCGVSFTPHVIMVSPGEDIAQKIVAFSKQGPRTVCVLSANGSICNASLRQPAHTGGVLNYEGLYEIISLSGSFLFSENNDGGQVRNGGLNVSLAGTDGRVVGGGVAGMLIAATPIQIIVGSFIANGKKTKYMPSVPKSHALNFSGGATLPAPESPPSEEVSSEEGSEENGGSNHIDRAMSSSYTNSNHPLHNNMHMYNPMGWPLPSSKMLHN